VQALSLVIELISIFTMICPIWGIILMIIGMALAFFLGKHQAEKEPPPGPIQKWFEDKGRTYLNTLKDPPPTRYNWQLLTKTAGVGKDTTLTISGTPRTDPINSTAMTNDFKNLAHIELKFSTAADEPGALFSTAKMTDLETGSLGPNQVAIQFPDALKPWVVFGTVDNSVDGAKVKTWSVLIKIKTPEDLKDEVDRQNASKPVKVKKPDDPEEVLPFITLANGEEFKFLIRGNVAKMGEKKDVGEIPKDVIPQWARHDITVTEHYADDKRLPLELIDVVLPFQKVD